MNLYELTGGNEDHPAYQSVVASNGTRHYYFLQSMVEAALDIGRPLLSNALIKAINFHAIAGLHDTAGHYRPCDVKAGDYLAPPHYRVQAMMDDFVNVTNWTWQTQQSVELATTALWRINHIHPFINGNGRTARAVCYFILCVKAGGWLPGNVILPELLRRDGIRQEYVDGLRMADAGDLGPLMQLVRSLLIEQLESATNVAASKG